MISFKFVKQLATTAALLALCTVPAMANAQEPPQSDPQGSMQGQDQAGTMMQHGQRPDELANLNLTDDQRAQVKKIHMDAKAQMDAVKGDATLSADQKQAKMMEIHKAAHQQVKQVLTPDQRKQMKADEMARKAAKQQGQQAPPPQQ
jgi:Spy/CpxP family protein refolding chaperone